MSTVKARVLRRTVDHVEDLESGALSLANYQWGLAVVDDILVARDNSGDFHYFMGADAIENYIDDNVLIKDPVANYSALVASDSGAICMTLDNGIYYRYYGGVWNTLGGAYSLGELSDVDLTGLNTNYFLRYNGSDWVPDNHLQLAGTGVTYGHIDDQAQTFAGEKTFGTANFSNAKADNWYIQYVGSSVLQASSPDGSYARFDVEGSYLDISSTGVSVSKNLSVGGDTTLGNASGDVATIRGNAVFTDQTASTLAIFNASKQLVSSAVTTANLTDLTDGGDSTLHYHSADRNRTNHTGTQTASTISDFASVVQSSMSGLYVAMTGNQTGIAGNKSFTGNITLGDSIGNAHTINGTISVSGVATFSNNILVGANNAYTLGNSTNRLANVHSVLGNFSGDVIGGSVAKSGILSGYPTLAEFNHKDSTQFGFVCGADGARTIGGSTFDVNTSNVQRFLISGSLKLTIGTAITASVPINGTSMSMSGTGTFARVDILGATDAAWAVFRGVATANNAPVTGFDIQGKTTNSSIANGLGVSHRYQVLNSANSATTLGGFRAIYNSTFGSYFEWTGSSDQQLMTLSCSTGKLSVAGVLNVTGGCDLGDSTADVHTINGTATVTQSFITPRIRLTFDGVATTSYTNFNTSFTLQIGPGFVYLYNANHTSGTPQITIDHTGLTRGDTTAVSLKSSCCSGATVRYYDPTGTYKTISLNSQRDILFLRSGDGLLAFGDIAW